MRPISRTVIFVALLLCGAASAQTIPPITRALNAIRPGAAWNLKGPNCADLEWLDQVQTVPTCDELNAAIAALPPAPVYLRTSVMLGRLTDAEYTAIMQAAQAQLTGGNGQLARWLDMARTQQNGVNLSDPVVATVKAALIGQGLLTSDRADIVFAP